MKGNFRSQGRGKWGGGKQDRQRRTHSPTPTTPQLCGVLAPVSMEIYRVASPQPLLELGEAALCPLLAGYYLKGRWVQWMSLSLPPWSSRPLEGVHAVGMRAVSALTLTGRRAPPKSSGDHRHEQQGAWHVLSPQHMLLVSFVLSFLKQA